MAASRYLVGRPLLINAGDIIDGTVTVSDAFGVYVDCNGVEYFIPLHELSWNRLKHATDVVARLAILAPKGEFIRNKTRGVIHRCSRWVLSFGVSTRKRPTGC